MLAERMDSWSFITVVASSCPIISGRGLGVIITETVFYAVF